MGQGLEEPKQSVDSLAILEEKAKAFRPVLIVPNANPISVLYLGDGTGFAIAFPSNRRHQLSLLVLFFRTLLPVVVPSGRSSVSFSSLPICLPLLPPVLVPSGRKPLLFSVLVSGLPHLSVFVPPRRQAMDTNDYIDLF